jgi:hypothetical protein
VRKAVNEVNFSVHVLRSLVKAVSVFCGLEKYDFLALDNISQWGVKNVDICSYRDVTAMALTAQINANNRQEIIL